MMLIDVGGDSSVKGLSVIGFHGDVERDETPAQLGPVYADAMWCHARIIEVGPTQHTPAGQVLVEAFPPPFLKDGPLPGHGTRVGPWPVQLDHMIVAVGPDERRLVAKLQQRARRHGKGRVSEFLTWFAGDEIASEALSCVRQNDIAIWYCHTDEGFLLLTCVERAVKRVFLAAVRSQVLKDIEDAAWWLARAAITDDDIYLASAALRRAGSADYETLLWCASVSMHLQQVGGVREKLKESDHTEINNHE